MGSKINIVNKKCFFRSSLYRLKMESDFLVDDGVMNIPRSANERAREKRLWDFEKEKLIWMERK